MRSTPFDLVFGELAEARFPAVRAALEAGGWDARDRDAFLMLPDVVSLVRELRPEEGVGEAIDQLVALLHHAFLFWQAGAPTLTLGLEATERLLRPDGPAPEVASREVPPAFYLQLAQRKVWARLFPEQPAEPMDGCFVDHTPEAALRVLGVFGIRPERIGFSVVEAEGPRAALERENATPLFTPTLPGGADAGLFEVTGPEELVELGWRGRDAAAAAGSPAGIPEQG